MADYCTIEEALALLPAVADVQSDLQGDAILASVTAEINMHLLGKGYALPITDVDALAALMTIAMNGTAARIAKSLWPTTKGPSGDSSAVFTLREDYQAGLAFIDEGGVAGEVTMTDAGTVIGHGFKDSAGNAFASSGLVLPITGETRF